MLLIRIQFLQYSFLIKSPLAFQWTDTIISLKAFIVKLLQGRVVTNSLTCKILHTAVVIKLQTNTPTLRRWQLLLFKEEEKDDKEELLWNMEEWLKRPCVSDTGRADSGPQEKKTKQVRNPQDF